MDENSLIKSSIQAGDIIKESGYESIIAAHKLLHSRIEIPQSYTAIIGETSSGKSTIINGLFSKKILPSNAVQEFAGVKSSLDELEKLRVLAGNIDDSLFVPGIAQIIERNPFS